MNEKLSVEIITFNNVPLPLADDDWAHYQQTMSCEFPPDLDHSEDEVLNLLLSLDVSKANGPDGISVNNY